MDTSMMLVDAAVVGASVTYMSSALGFVNTARKNTNAHKSNPIIQEHFNDHCSASVAGIVGGCMGLAFGIIHFIAQNILNANEMVLGQIEYGRDIGLILVLVSGSMFMRHMQKEETPGHPFYVQEYGPDVDANVEDQNQPN